MKRLWLMTLILVFGQTMASAETSFVQKVIDARTLQMIDGSIVRLIGVDLPADQTKEQAAASAEFVRHLVSGGLVELEYDSEKYDQTGHLLAYVWFIYPAHSQESFSRFPEEYKITYKIQDHSFDAFFVFLNATVIKAGHGMPDGASANARHTELFQQLYDARQMTTAKLELPREEVLSIHK